MISFTRTHPDGVTSTTYRARVIAVPARQKVFMRGRFVRTMPNAAANPAALATLAGDWETEKPT